MRSLVILVATAGIALSMASEALADLPAQAKFHESRGRALYGKGDFRSALREFFALRRLVPLPRTTFNIALCFDQLEERAQAFFFFSTYLEIGPDDADTRDYAHAALKRLAPSLARLRIETSPLGAEVFVDRKEHGSWGQTPITIPVRAGVHRVWVSKPGFRPQTLELEASAGAVRTLSLSLAPSRGEVRIDGPEGAWVALRTLDGATLEEGASPFTRSVAPGAYVAEVSASGFRPDTVVLAVEQDKVTSRRLTLEALPAPTGQVIVAANLPGALVEIDGEPIGFTPTQLPDVPLGLHRVRVSAEGREDWSAEIAVVRRRTGYLSVSLEPPTEEQRSAWTWIAGGIGAASLGAGVVLGAAALDTSSQYDAALASGSLELESLRARGEAYAGVADGFLVAGGLALATSVLLYFLTAEDSTPTTGSYHLESAVELSPLERSP